MRSYGRPEDVQCLWIDYLFCFGAVNRFEGSVAQFTVLAGSLHDGLTAKPQRTWHSAEHELGMGFRV